jgi:aerobic C4-dicarboxylate transport protein
VLPVGYSFNADGTAIYLSMASLFIAQAYGIGMSFGQQLGLLLLLLVTSKGSGSVAGSGFVVLAATLSATHVLPVEGLLLIIGIDRFMSEARSVTNIIGNSLATVVVAKMSGEFAPSGCRLGAARQPGRQRRPEDGPDREHVGTASVSRGDHRRRPSKIWFHQGERP